jgi:hypothetical protein
VPTNTPSSWSLLISKEIKTTRELALNSPEDLCDPPNFLEPPFEEKLDSGLIISGAEKNISALCSVVKRRLADGSQLPDIAFDLLYRTKYRRVSDMFWTPVAVAKRAVSWLPSEKSLKILDVGCGIGKFCLIGALSSRHRTFGIESRNHLFQESRRVGRLFPGAPVSLKLGNAFHYDWAPFDALYLFNPFVQLLGHNGEAR